MNPITLRIGEQFSKSAASYDAVAALQRTIADRLLSNIVYKSAAPSILDIGTGTGYLMQRLQEQNTASYVCGIDCAFGMVAQARSRCLHTPVLQADALALPFKRHSFNIVVSNVALQWIRNTRQAFEEIKRVLQSDGDGYGTIFTSNTLKQLRDVIIEVEGRDASVSLGSLQSQETINQAAQRAGLTVVSSTVYMYQPCFVDAISLLRWLKILGANRYWSPLFFRGIGARRFIDRICSVYDQRYRHKDGITADFEVLCLQVRA